MVSWKLFTHVIAAKDSLDDPVYQREADHAPAWYGPLRRAAASPGFAPGVTVAGSLLCIMSALAANNLLVVLLPPLALLVIGTATTLGPVVARERANRSWDLLLTIPAGAERVLLGKAGGALWWLRQIMFVAGLLIVFASFGVGFISLILVPTRLARAENWSEFVLCGAIVVLPLAGAALFVIDRVQQYLLMVVAALAASTASSSNRAALSTASAAVLLIWVFEVAASGAALALNTHHVGLTTANLIALIAAGPVAQFIMELEPGWAVVAVVGTLLLREALLSALWRWTLRRAQM